MAKLSAMQIANAVADAVSKAQNKKSKPPKAQAVEEPSLNGGKSGSSMANPDDQKTDEDFDVGTNSSKPMPNKSKSPASHGTIKSAKK